MHYVYLVKLPNGEIHTGYSSDLRTRIKRHKQAKDIIGLIYYEAYQHKGDALAKERQLKNTKVLGVISVVGYSKALRASKRRGC